MTVKNLQITHRLAISLFGAVGYGAGHYVSYIRRFSGKWEIHNALEKKFKKCLNPETTKINPHLIFYA
ncbi:Uncharacterized protein FWK35_00036824, partial [Aphis craccivora]